MKHRANRFSDNGLNSSQNLTANAFNPCTYSQKMDNYNYLAAIASNTALQESHSVNNMGQSDISKKISASILNKLAEGIYQEKKEALLELEDILKGASMSIMPNGLIPLFNALKILLEAPNKSIKRCGLGFCMKLIEALGASAKRYKNILPGVLNNLSDTQILVREEAIKVLRKWTEFNGIEALITISNTYLLKDNFYLRNELLNFLKSIKKYFDRCDLIPITEGIISCLIDRNFKIRSLAEEMSSEILYHVHVSNFDKHYKKYKPEIANSIRDIINKYKSNNHHMKMDSKAKNSNPNNVNNNIINYLGNEINRSNSDDLGYFNNNLNFNNANNNNKNNNNDAETNNNAILIIINNNSNNVIENNYIPNINNDYTENQKIYNMISYLNNDINQNKSGNNDIQFFLQDSTRPKQKINRLKDEEALAFPHEFLIDSYVYLLKDNFLKIIDGNFVKHGFSKNILDVKTFFLTLSQIAGKNFFQFQENSDIFIKLLMIKYFETAKAGEGLNVYEEILNTYFDNVLKLIDRKKNFLHKTEFKFIFEILNEIFFRKILKRNNDNSNNFDVEKYLCSFCNLCEADNLLSIYMSFIKKKIETANDSYNSILIALKFFNSFSKNKNLMLSLTENFNFKVFEPIFHLINGNSLLNQNERNHAYRDLNRIHYFLSEKNKFNLENYILNFGFEISILIENPQITL